MRMILFVFNSLILIFFLSKEVFPAACCGGGGALPSIILNDDRWSLKAGASSAFAVADSESSGESRWRDDPFSDRSMTYTLSGVFRISDRFQSGLRTAFRERRLENRSHQAFGDSRFDISLEPFPPYTYQAWRPRFFLLGSLQIPTGSSTYEVQDPNLESTGSGFYTPGVGLLIQKTFDVWDYLIYGELKFQLSRDFDRDRIKPGKIYSGRAGIGYSFKVFRWGLSAGPSYEEKKEFVRGRSMQPTKMLWDADIDMSVRFSDEVSSSIAYADQTLIGPTWNARLERSLSWVFVYHGV